MGFIPRGGDETVVKEGKKGDKGDQGLGTQGIPGVPGARGSLWFSGVGPPGVIPGQQDGDLYLDTATDDAYQLQSGVWVLVGDFTGTAGPAGPQNLYVQQAPGPVFTMNGLWIELWPDDTVKTFWVESGF